MSKGNEIGFRVVQVLMECEYVEELDEAKKILDNVYNILREQLVVLNNVGLPR